MQDFDSRHDAQLPEEPRTVPAGVPSWITQELIEQTLRTWQPYYSQPLTVVDAIAMIRSASRLFEVLSRE